MADEFAATAAKSKASSNDRTPRVKRFRVVGAAAAFAAVGAAAVAVSVTEIDTAPRANAAPKPTATVSGAASPKANYQYFDSITPSYEAMDASLKNISTAVESQNWNALSSGCQTLAGSGDSFAGSLPSPDSRITPRMQRVASEIGSAADVCMSWGPGAPADVAQMMSHIDTAMKNLRAAKKAVGFTF